MSRGLVFFGFLLAACGGLGAAGDASGHLQLGQYFLDHHAPGRAIAEFEAAAQLRPEWTEAHYDLGIALRAWGDLQGAERELRRVLQLQPRYPQAHFALGLVLGDRVGSEKLGLGEFEAAVAQDPGYADAHFNIGVIQWKTGAIEPAVASFRRAVQGKPDSAEYRFRFGQALAKAGDVSGAERELRRAVELDPAHRGAWYQLSAVYARRGAHAEAAEALEKFKSIQREGPQAVERDQSALHFQMGMSALARGQLGSAIDQFDHALKGARDEAKVRNALGIARQRKGDLAEAANEFHKAAALNPRSLDAHVNLGTLLTRTGDLSGAEREFGTALSLDPNFAEARFNLGMVMAAQRRMAEARGHLEQCIRLAPGNARARGNLARVLRDSGDPAAALTEFRLAWNLDHSLAEVGLEYGKLLWQQNLRQEALAVWKDALKRNPLELRLQKCYLDGLDTAGDRDTQVRERDRFGILNHGEYAGAVEHLNRREYGQAVEAASFLLRQHPGLSDARRTLAFAQFAQHQYAAAAAEYARLVAEDPKDADLRLNLGAALAQIPEPRKAVGELEEALRLNPQSAQAHFQLGLLCKASGDLDIAMQHFHQARRIDPSLQPPE